MMFFLSWCYDQFGLLSVPFFEEIWEIFFEEFLVARCYRAAFIVLISREEILYELESLEMFRAFDFVGLGIVVGEVKVYSGADSRENKGMPCETGNNLWKK